MRRQWWDTREMSDGGMKVAMVLGGGGEVEAMKEKNYKNEGRIGEPYFF